MRPAFKTVDEYIISFPVEVQPLLQEMRTAIRAAAPRAVEGIAYGMPAYKMGGKPLVYFAGFARHIGFYAIPTAQARFAAQLSTYKQGKGSVQFPLDRPIPLDLIGKMVAFKLKELAAK